METSTMTTKGQVTVPVAIREELGLRAGDRLVFTRIPGTKRYQLFRKTGSAKSLIGMFKCSKKAPTLEQIDDAIGNQIQAENAID